jgi:hypothetical protein
MKVKILIVTALCLMTTIQLTAQVSIEYGPKLGMNIAMHYGTKEDAEDYQVKTGIRAGMNAGMYLDMVILPQLSLGYEVLYSQKGSREKITITGMEIDGVWEDLVKPAVMDVKYYMDYIEVPILLKVKVLDKPGWSMQAITGTAMGLKVAGSYDLKGKVYFPDGNSYTEIPINENSHLEEVNMFDYSFVYGGNVELKGKIPLIIEYRFTLGWDYISLPTYQFFEPVQLRNQTYSLNFGTRF